MKRYGYMVYAGLLVTVLFSVFYSWLQVGSVGMAGSKYPPDIPEIMSHISSDSMEIVLSRNIFGEASLRDVDGVLKSAADQAVDMQSKSLSLTQLRLIAIATDSGGALRAVIRAEIPGKGVIVRSYVHGDVLADGSKIVHLEKGRIELMNDGVTRRIALFRPVEKVKER